MAAIVIYLIKWALLLAAGVALFMLLMRGETFHRFNRGLLLAIALLSMALPAVRFSIDSPMARFTSAVEWLVGGEKDNVLGPSIMIDEPMAVVLDDAPAADASPWQRIASLGALEWLFIVYVVVALLLVVRLLYMYVQIIAILRSGRREDISAHCPGSGAYLIVHDSDYKPFSWFRRVAISRTDLCECGREILTHEAAHVQCGHSYDILFADLIIILQWFNPMAWIMKSLLKDIHEYEADSAVLTAGVDAKSYQLLIIKKAVGARLYSIANSFNHSLTKKRITMMYKEKSSLWRCTKALYIVPLAVVAACSFSSPESKSEGKGNEKIENRATDGKISSLDVAVTDAGAGAAPERDVPEVLNVVKEPDVAAKYPGGMPAMMQFLSRKIKYPKEAQEKREEGKTHVQFVVKSDGTIDCVQVARSSGSQALDDEAVRVVKSMPRWTPAQKDGENVNTMFTLPVVFKLGGGVPQVAVDAPESRTGKQEIVDVKVTLADEAIYQVVEQQPEFKGGANALMKYLSSNINYPREAMEQNIQGKAFIGFVVEKDGSITDVNVVKSSGNELLDQESVRVVKSMPKWNPGKQSGRAVRVRFTLPVMFRLQ
ncbi:MAG: TonB family protein [Bacteroidaceae bacterium]|nr:TonB family protein [Bacteroidaceae bacterium]